MEKNVNWGDAKKKKKGEEQKGEEGVIQRKLTALGFFCVHLAPQELSPSWAPTVLSLQLVGATSRLFQPG